MNASGTAPLSSASLGGNSFGYMQMLAANSFMGPRCKSFKLTLFEQLWIWSPDIQLVSKMDKKKISYFVCKAVFLQF